MWSEMKLIGASTTALARLLRLHFAQVIENIGLEPWLPGRSAAALVHQGIVGDTQPLRDKLPHFFELADIVAGVRHRERDAVGDVDNLDVLFAVRRKLSRARRATDLPLLP